MGFKMTGMDELQRNLKRLEQRAKTRDGPQSVRLDELYSPAFLAAHTAGKFRSIDEWVRQSPFEISSQEDLERITDQQWDPYVRSTTDFASMTEMKEAAVAAYTKHRLGL